MAAAEALLDSNVIVAAVAEDHIHHEASAALFSSNQSHRFAVAAHSYAECFVTLTRRNASAPFHWNADEAWAALQNIAAGTLLVGLSPAQTVDAVRVFSEGGRIGARIYDHLIGEAALRHGIGQIITWNVAHMRGLFPDLVVKTPAQFAEDVSD